MKREFETLISIYSSSIVSMTQVIINIRRFYDLMRLSKFYTELEDLADFAECLQDATLLYMTTKNMLVNLLKPEDNVYIAKYERNYRWMIECIGRADKNLNTYQAQRVERIMSDTQIRLQPIAKTHIKSYNNYLIESMETMVIRPLINAYERFMTTSDQVTFIIKEDINKENSPMIKEIKTIVKDRELFCYFLFLEIYHASLSVGALTRDEDTKNRTSFQDTPTIITRQLPSNIKTESQEEKNQEGERNIEEDLYGGEPF